MEGGAGIVRGWLALLGEGDVLEERSVDLRHPLLPMLLEREWFEWHDDGQEREEEEETGTHPERPPRTTEIALVAPAEPYEPPSDDAGSAFHEDRAIIDGAAAR